MKITYFIIVITILFSCNKYDERLNITFEYEDNTPTHVINRRAGNSGVFYVPVYSIPVINSNRVAHFDYGETMQLMEIGDSVSFNDIDAIWYRIRSDRVNSGWVTSNYLMDIRDVDFSALAMNKIDIQELLIPDRTGEKYIINVVDDFGHFHFEYGDINISVIYHSKDIELDGSSLWYDIINPNYFLLTEINLYMGMEKFHIITPNYTNHRINSINGLMLIDAFSFCQFEAQDISLQRRVYFSDFNYNYEIYFGIPYFTLLNYIDAILIEAQEYFIPGDGSDPRMKWDTANNAIERFGDDLINNRNPSDTVVNWFLETEIFLDELFFR